jgi:hypothetical protein
MEVRRLDWFVDRASVVLVGHYPPPFEVSLELVCHPDWSAPSLTCTQYGVEFAEKETCSRDGEVEKLRFSSQRR